MGATASLSGQDVVIVGAGYGGVNAANFLTKKGAKVTLIEKNDSRTHSFATLRAAVVPTWEQQIRVPLDCMTKNQYGGEVKQGEVASVESKKVTLKDGTVIDCDAVVLANGYTSSATSKFPFSGPPSTDEHMEMLRDAQTKIANAKHVLIIGGGPIGVEFAGEVAAQHPGKAVTIVHSGKSLLSGAVRPINERVVRSLMRQLDQMGVTVKLNTRVEEIPQTEKWSSFAFGEHEVALNDGSSVTADVVFVATGNRPRPRDQALVSDEFVDERGHVKVNDFLQVEGMDGVFAIGDTTNVNETKMGFFAMNHAKVVGPNVVSYLSSRTPSKRYTPMASAVMIVPLGPRRGAGGFGNTVFGPFMTRTLKGGSLMVGDVWKQNNTKPPRKS